MNQRRQGIVYSHTVDRVLDVFVIFSRWTVQLFLSVRHWAVEIRKLDQRAVYRYHRRNLRYVNLIACPEVRIEVFNSVRVRVVDHYIESAHAVPSFDRAA